MPKGVYVGMVVVAAFLLWGVAPKAVTIILSMILLLTLINTWPTIEATLKGGA